MKEPKQLSGHFSYGRLWRFTMPTIGMMIFTSLYGMVDGFFVSNFAGKTPFAAINFAWPLISMLCIFGFMLGTGGNAIISRLLGQQEKAKAQEIFSMLVYIALGVGVVLAIIGVIWIRPLLAWLGASEEMMPYCVTYSRILLIALPASFLQYEFQSFLATAGKPRLGLHFTLAAGITNMVLDALFIAGFGWGITGAAVATVVSVMVGGIAPLVYFAMPNSSLLRLRAFRFDRKAFVDTCVNGSSELLSTVSMSLVSMLYNYQLMRFIGLNGVAAYGTLMYVTYIFVSCFVGYCVGVAPLIGYNYGSENHGEMRNLFRKSIVLIGVFSIVMTLAAELLAAPISNMYVGYDSELNALTVKAFHIYSLSFLLCGFNIFGSALFTALGNGLVSAGISFFRTMVCEVIAVLVLPLVLGIDGIWYAIVVAETAALLLTVSLVLRHRKRYHYL